MNSARYQAVVNWRVTRSGLAWFTSYYLISSFFHHSVIFPSSSSTSTPAYLYSLLYKIFLLLPFLYLPTLLIDFQPSVSLTSSSSSSSYYCLLSLLFKLGHAYTLSSQWDFFIEARHTSAVWIFKAYLQHAIHIRRSVVFLELEAHRLRPLQQTLYLSSNTPPSVISLFPTFSSFGLGLQDKEASGK